MRYRARFFVVSLGNANIYYETLSFYPKICRDRFFFTPFAFGILPARQEQFPQEGAG
jgi:hypothetical protein